MFKNNLIRVRCIECKEEKLIPVYLIGTEQEQRTIGIEYEHIFRGESNCLNCNERMRLLITLYEFPKNYFNYVDTSSEACLVMNDINEDSFTLINR